MKALIKQPAGIGDIFFCQKIAHKLRQQNYDVVWPVIPEFLWIKDYIKDIEFCNINEVLHYNYDAILPLHDADKLFPGISVMEAKYKLVDLRYDDWCKYFDFKHNYHKEEQLFYDVLKLADDTPYVLKNFYFASPPQTQICEAAKNANCNNMREICMTNLPDFTLLDWCKVISKAKTIHTVETSINYIIEKVDSTKDLHMYSKWKPSSFFHIKNLFKKPWRYYE
jgi:hypothetical protein